MRRIPALLLVAAFATAASGCLSSIIPDHHASTGADAGAPQSTGGGGGGGGDPTQTPTGGGATDDLGTDDGGVAQSANDPNCIATAAPVIDGHHNAGMACLTCHDGNTGGANKFSAAGTVYDKLALASGAKGLAGVTIEITDAAGTKVTVVTASQGAAGNFWTQTPLVFPLKVRASQCPADRPMTDPLAANANVALGDGNCARSGCHDSNMIIHVP